jgi:hypothetical protein
VQALGWGSRYPQRCSMRLLRSMPRRAPGVAHEPSSCLPCCSRSRASLRSLQSAARNVAVAAPAAPSAAPCGHVARCPCGLWCCGRLQLWFAAASNRALRSALCKGTHSRGGCSVFPRARFMGSCRSLSWLVWHSGRALLLLAVLLQITRFAALAWSRFELK